MLRIEQSTTAGTTSIALQGKLLSPWRDAVSGAVAAAQSGAIVQLDLTALSFVDHDGVELLRVLQRQGVELAGASAFIEGLLATPP
jgi:anti-anti-sigma regulatory factor